MIASRPRPRGRAAVLGSATGVLVVAGALALPGATVPGGTGVADAAARCSTPAPKAKGAGSAAAAVKRLVRGVGTRTSKAPKVGSPKGRPPSRLVKDDVVRCPGRRAKVGDTLEVRYSLVVWGGKKQVVDSTWSRGSGTASFGLERGGLIEGWIKGVPGMTAGSRRVLVVPPSQGYGSEGTAGVPARSTLIFVIDLVKIG
ncbi:FKBP-type peptidyl-prolyl cis-trans isomerase [Patulibacter sp. NPDC049589]|uniref:FKBP-type peptidyl-prolyl cis-trans isomerase n=1 Tax=Patulibacter sp. NPDC049589 TaxID=3154731 RepID=UPI00342B04B4